MPDNDSNIQSDEKTSCCRKICLRKDSSYLEDENINCLLNCCHNKKIKKVFKILRPLNLLIFMLIFGFSITLRKRYRDNLIYRQLCIDRFKTDYSICYTVGKNNVTEKDFMVLDVLKLSISHVIATLGLKICAEFISACILCSWSDSYGRIFPLVIAVLSENFDISSFFFRDISFIYFIWAFYIMSILSGVFGGDICIFAMSYSFLTDQSSLKYRAISFTMIDFMHVMGMILGIASSKIMISGDILLVSFFYLLAIRCILILWVLLTFSERQLDSSTDSLVQKFKNLFSVAHLLKTFEAISRWRRDCGSQQLCLLIISGMPVMVTYSLFEGVTLGSRIHAKYFNSYEEYERIAFYFALYGCIAEPIVIVTYQRLRKFKDSTLGVIGLCSLYFGFFIGAFATEYIIFIIAFGIALVKGLSVVALRSAVSRIAEKADRGKIFYMYASGEVTAVFIGYAVLGKLRHVMTEGDDILLHMILCMLLILPLCTFIFQVMSIHTSHLFEACYRIFPVMNTENIEDDPQESQRTSRD